MAQSPLEQLAMDFTEQANNPGGISLPILNGAGGAGLAATPGGGSVLAFDPYTSPYLQPRRIFFTINTFTNLSKKGVLAKAYLDGVEIEGQTNTNGRITFSLEEARFLNPTRLTLVSGDLRPQKYFLIQSRKDSQNQVSITEYDTSEGTTSSNPVDLAGGGGAGVLANTGGGAVDTRGGQYDGSGGGMTSGINSIYETGFGREQVLRNANQNENFL